MNGNKKKYKNEQSRTSYFPHCYQLTNQVFAWLNNDRKPLNYSFIRFYYFWQLILMHCCSNAYIAQYSARGGPENRRISAPKKIIISYWCHGKGNRIIIFYYQYEIILESLKCHKKWTLWMWNSFIDFSATKQWLWIGRSLMKISLGIWVFVFVRVHF